MAENPTRALSRTQQPDSEPISLAEAKLFLRVDHSDDDALIATLISAVRSHAEEYLRKSLASQTWKLTYEDYAPLCTPLPHGPVMEILSVIRRDRQGIATIVDAATYHLNARADQLHFDSMVMAYEVEVLYEAGYGEVEEVPASVRQGMLLHLATLYENRTGGIDLPAATLTLYKPHRAVYL